MDFDLSEEQKMLRQTVDRLLGDYIETSRQSAWLDERPPPDPKLDRALAELGLDEAIVDHGASQRGMDLLSLAVVAERLGWHAAPSPVIERVLALWLLGKAGAPFADVAHQIGSGRKTAAFAFTEGGERVLPQDWRIEPTAANGRKPKVLWGDHADMLIVGLSGGCLGLVEADAAGVRRGSVNALDRSRPACDIVFEGAEIRPLAVDAETVDALFDAMIILAAADACGAGERATDIAVAYAKERRQFGRPIGSFQGVKHQLANIALEVMPNRPLVWYAAHLWDLRHEGASRTASLVKAYVTDIAVRAGRAAVEIHGGIGYTWDYPLHIFLKRAMVDRAICGLPATHQERAVDLTKNRDDRAATQTGLVLAEQ